MIMKGQKRKLPPEDEDMEVLDRCCPTWESQRQFVFSVSMSKYQRSQELPEPSLRRSVLIANTLRQVALEARRVPTEDGEDGDVSRSPRSSTVDAGQLAYADCPMFSSNDLSNCAASRSPASCHSSESNVPMSGEDEDWGSMSTDTDFSLSVAIASILNELDSTMDGSPQAAPRPPLRSLENLSGPSEGQKQGVRGYGVSWEEQEELRARDNSVEVMRSSYLGDLTVEDLFQDIDTSLLEMDMGVLGLRSSGGGYPAGEDLLRYLPPLSSSSSSLSLNPSPKCLPSFSSFSQLPSSCSPSLSLPTSSSFGGVNHARDGFELEHLMEILVES
ncbi:SERTA domain-containing protein 3 [Brachyistius frenatus]|uniref:SERTA domain-containing protein 3 n=1 Tax=Brachyistius frenatus TaxID=100188 RepID=UPI0037E91BEE